MVTARSLIGSVLGIGLLAWTSCYAGTVEFSADAIQRSPQSDPVTAHMYVGKAGVRKEYTVNDQLLVEIFDYANSRAVLLNEKLKQYMEQNAPSKGVGDWSKTSANPCEGVQDATCRKMGREKLQGRVADKWEMTVDQSGEKVQAFYWLDVERKMPLKQSFPDGTVSEMHFLGRESVNGRKAEKWEMVTTRKDGETMRSYQWYDPELNIAIREELPGGFTRELTNIKVGPQPGNLFTIPANYELIPSAGSGQQQPSSGAGGYPTR
jgi:hypothetical protein